MAFQFIIRHRAAMPWAALTTGLLLVPKSSVHAEEPLSTVESLDKPSLRKPIYDDAVQTPVVLPTPTAPESAPTSTSPSPTERLAEQVARSRIFLHKYVATAEDKTNEVISKAFKLEHSFTSTIASLAPPKESSEKIIPGGIYVLVAAMGASILARNRNILLRATFPLAVGIGAGWVLIPLTMRNVADLAWTYEKRFPVVADTHLRIKESVERFVETGVAHSKMGVGMLEDKVGEAREKVDEWVKKGR